MGVEAELQWVEERMKGDKMETSADGIFIAVVSVAMLASDLGCC